jgi:hypothetical protein
VLTFPRANRAQKVSLSVAAKIARLPHHFEHLRSAVDDDAELFARVGRERRGG